MTTRQPRIVDIALDERTILWRSADVEQERRVAIFDLLEDNYFDPVPELGGVYAGPWRIVMRIEEGRLAIDLQAEDEAPIATLMLALTPFKRVVRDYFAICDGYYKAIRSATPSQIETVDMARRGIHNRGAEMLQTRIADKAQIDFDTARRLFTLICVLHIRQ